MLKRSFVSRSVPSFVITFRRINYLLVGRSLSLMFSLPKDQLFTGGPPLSPTSLLYLRSIIFKKVGYLPVSLLYLRINYLLTGWYLKSPPFQESIICWKNAHFPSYILYVRINIYAGRPATFLEIYTLAKNQLLGGRPASHF